MRPRLLWNQAACQEPRTEKANPPSYEKSNGSHEYTIRQDNVGIIKLIELEFRKILRTCFKIEIVGLQGKFGVVLMLIFRKTEHSPLTKLGLKSRRR